jgi:transposase-like protein
MKTGKITNFEVTAQCPHCDNETKIIQSELKNCEADCQHCNKLFTVELDV